MLLDGDAKEDPYLRQFVSSGDIQRTYAIHEKTLRSWADS
jgi:hypothetical protein